MKINLILAYDRKIDRNWVPSLGLGYISSYFQKNQKKISISIENNINDILKNKPDIVGISSSTQNIETAINYAKLIKKKINAKIILGGPHITALPKLLPSVFDYGIIGEGEQTFLELSKYFLQPKNKKIEDIKGIVYWKNKNIFFTESRNFIKNLDILPIPDRKQLIYNKSTIHMMTSRGCPNHCVFCGSNCMWKTPRYFSVDYIINEIEDIIFKFQPKVINFFDDIFFKNKKTLKEIRDIIILKKINKKVCFTCYMRADIVDEEIMELLKDIGVIYIFFGAESGSDKVLKYLKNANSGVNKNQDFLDLAYKYNIKVGATFIKGTPIETENNLISTYKFIEKNLKSKKIDIWKIFFLSPFPGTAMWNFANKKGIVSENMNFSEFKKPYNYLYMNQYITKSKFNIICNKWENKLKKC